MQPTIRESFKQSATPATPLTAEQQLIETLKKQYADLSKRIVRLEKKRKSDSEIERRKKKKNLAKVRRNNRRMNGFKELKRLLSLC